jgi:hypothetical protein
MIMDAFGNSQGFLQQNQAAVASFNACAFKAAWLPMLYRWFCAPL